MGMNIKNPETQRLVRELSALTGESRTAAITEAVRQRLNQLRRERERGLAERLVAIGKDCAPRLREPFRSAEHGDLLREAGIVIDPVTEEQARIARAAYRDFGKGSGHPAKLNFGDCFAYALAKVSGEPLLFKGADFTHTDISR